MSSNGAEAISRVSYSPEANQPTESTDGLVCPIVDSIYQYNAL